MDRPTRTAHTTGFQAIRYNQCGGATAWSCRGIGSRGGLRRSREPTEQRALERRPCRCRTPRQSSGGHPVAADCQTL